MNKEIVQLIRSSAGFVEVLKTYLVSGDHADADRKEKVAKVEEMFKDKLSHMDDEELEDALEQGMGDEPDGDTVSIVWSFIDE